jgi:hypothetical protein
VWKSRDIDPIHRAAMRMKPAAMRWVPNVDAYIVSGTRASLRMLRRLPSTSGSHDCPTASEAKVSSDPDTIHIRLGG